MAVWRCSVKMRAPLALELEVAVYHVESDDVTGHAVLAGLPNLPPEHWWHVEKVKTQSLVAITDEIVHRLENHALYMEGR